jgi:hypothetical protein
LPVYRGWLFQSFPIQHRALWRNRKAYTSQQFIYKKREIRLVNKARKLITNMRCVHLVNSFRMSYLQLNLLVMGRKR